MLFCRNCGGKLILDESAEEIMCESCGQAQSLQSLTYTHVTPLYDNSGDAGKVFNTYCRALKMYTQGETVQAMETAALMFKNISNVLNAKDMAEKCQQKGEILEKENRYQQALTDMYSEDPKRVNAAIEVLRLLVGYKDADQKANEAQRLLEIAIQKEKERTVAVNKARARKRRIRIAIVAGLALVAILLMIGRANKYKAENLSLTLIPCNDYLTVQNNKYTFFYNVNMKNNGRLDIKRFQAQVVMEDPQGTVLVDVQMQASDYTALVREGKSRNMTWELTTTDENVALALYEDFYSLKIRIIITQIEFADGTIKNYQS